MEAINKETIPHKWLSYLPEEIAKVQKLSDPSNTDLSQIESEIEMRLFTKGVDYPDGTGDAILSYLISGE